MSVSGFACLCIFPPFVRGGNKASNKQVRESDSLSDTEGSSTTRTVRTQRFLIKWLLLSFKKGNDFKKRSVSVLFWRQALRRMRKAVCQGQKEEGNHPVCRAKPEDWGNLFLFIYPWSNQDKPLWGVSGDKHGEAVKLKSFSDSFLQRHQCPKNQTKTIG